MNHSRVAAVPRSISDSPSAEWDSAPHPVDEQHASRVRQCFEEYRSQVVRWLALRIGSAAQASEITDQAFTRLLELPHPERVGNLKAYVYKIASNIAAERAHTAAVHRRIQGMLAHEAEGADPSPQSLWLEEERLETLKRVLETLPPRVRWALRMRFWDNFQYNEITKLLRQRGIVVNLRTVQRWVAYGLERCREEFQRREGGTASERGAGSTTRMRRRDATRWFVEDESADELP